MYKLCHGEISGYWLKLFLIKPEYYNKKLIAQGIRIWIQVFFDDKKISF
jgi:hypothetical protein